MQKETGAASVSTVTCQHVNPGTTGTSRWMAKEVRKSKKPKLPGNLNDDMTGPAMIYDSLLQGRLWSATRIIYILGTANRIIEIVPGVKSRRYPGLT
jgi:hypothetical protein